jgi:chemotaxis protein MotA
LGLIFSAIILGGSSHLFLNLEATMIVLGGTVAASLFTFQLKDVLTAFKAAFLVFSTNREDPNDMVSTMIELCTLSRRQGLVALSKLEIESDFLRKACNMIADGSKEDLIRDTLQIEIESMKQRHSIIQDVFTQMGVYSPSFGMIGTLIGLIQMMNTLNDPTKVGPAMAIALTTTFYGAFFANMFFLPIAGKLRSQTKLEVIKLEIISEGAVSILENNNPLMVYEKLSSFIPTKLRRPMQNQILKKK